MAQFTGLLDRVLYLFSILSAYPVLEWICTKWLPDDGSCASQLLAGVGDMVDADAGLDLWRMAAAADNSDKIRALMPSDDDWDTLEGKLSQFNQGRDFLESWRRFMHNHGHHCRGEIELYNHRWFETPDYILKLVRGYMSQIGKIDPVGNHAERAKQRRQLEQKCRRQLRNPVKRLIFNRFLVHSQQGWVFRENVKSEVVKLLTAMRKMLLELGSKLADKEVFAKPDDIFFLRLDEIEPAAAIVMDEGGMISHGSIIAREYGIPAVVNAGDATRIIKTGQKIRVDGDRGIVTIIK